MRNSGRKESIVLIEGCRLKENEAQLDGRRHLDERTEVGGERGEGVVHFNKRRARLSGYA
jgi:hypothetical protein